MTDKIFEHEKAKMGFADFVGAELADVTTFGDKVKVHLVTNPGTGGLTMNDFELLTRELARSFGAIQWDWFSGAGIERQFRKLRGTFRWSDGVSQHEVEIDETTFLDDPANIKREVLRAGREIADAIAADMGPDLERIEQEEARNRKMRADQVEKAKKLAEKEAALRVLRLAEERERAEEEKRIPEMADKVKISRTKERHIDPQKIKKPHCPIHTSTRMEFDEMGQKWSCPVPECNQVARPKHSAEDNAIFMGKGKIQLRLMFLSNGAPRMILISDNNVALDVTPFFDMDDVDALFNLEGAIDDAKATGRNEFSIPAEQLLKFKTPLYVMGVEHAQK